MNRLIIIIFVSILNNGVAFSQEIVRECVITFGKRISSEHFKQKGSNYKWVFNGQEFKADTGFVHLNPNYPEFDTLIFEYKHPHYGISIDTILTRLKPNEKYMFTIGCCDSYFNIVQLDNDYNPKSNEKDSLNYCFKTIVNGYVRFMLTGYNEADTLIGLYTDYAGMVEGKVIINNKKTEYFKANKGYYTTNIDNIVVAKLIGSPKYLITEDNMIDWNGTGSDGLLTLAKQRIALLYNEKVTAYYNYKTDKLTIKIDE
jgi:hypothetical protein